MLNKPVDDIIMENGKVVGVQSEGEVSLFLSAVMVVWVGLVPLLRGSLRWLCWVCCHSALKTLGWALGL